VLFIAGESVLLYAHDLSVPFDPIGTSHCAFGSPHDRPRINTNPRLVVHAPVEQTYA
jgi:hypothetical protein